MNFAWLVQQYRHTESRPKFAVAFRLASRPRLGTLHDTNEDVKNPKATVEEFVPLDWINDGNKRIRGASTPRVWSGLGRKPYADQQ